MPTRDRRKPKNDVLDWPGKVGIFIMPILVLSILAELAIRYPMASIWISDAAQAEFVGTTGPSISGPEPVHF